ncbi:hypothetical protein O9992_27470 [Vibrio lentus]|nr:hypothetical protein [Vibrio lentus]
MKSAVRNKGKKALGVAFGITKVVVYIGLCLIGVGSILQFCFSDDRLKNYWRFVFGALCCSSDKSEKCNYSNIECCRRRCSIQTTFS